MRAAGLWGLRAILFALGVLAPALGFQARVAMVGDVKLAVDGILWGFIGTIVLAIAFGLTFRTTATGRLFRAALVILATFAAWFALAGLGALIGARPA